MDYAKYAMTNLIKELGIDKLPKEMQEKVLMQIGEMIQQRVVIRLFEEMSQEKKDEFEIFSKENEKDPVKLTQFLESNVENSKELVKEEIGKAKKEIIDMIGGLKAKEVGAVKVGDSPKEE